MRFSRILFFLITFSFISNHALAALSFSLKSDEIIKTKILFIGFDSTHPDLKIDSFNILQLIRKNLKTTDLFEVLEQSNPIDITLQNGNIASSTAEVKTPQKHQQSISIESVPDFDKYIKAGISAIIVAQLNYDVSGNLEVRIRMWDALDQRQLFGKFYTASKDNYRRVANIISDQVFKAITGENIGHFTSKILYVAESGPIRKRIKKLRIMDFDGQNNKILTDGRDLVLTPVFSKKENEIYYLRFFRGRPQVHSFNLVTFRSKRVGGFAGTTFAAAPHPQDSNRLLLSVIINGNSDIYEFNVLSNSALRLTKNPAIDTTPSYSPSGKFITFSSDRDSGQQIYVMDSQGLSISRITSGKGSYAKPVWSPDGKLIAFTKMRSGHFYIGVIAPNGKGERLLASGYLVEGARWSPSGRYLIYSKKRGPYGAMSIPRLFVLDIITGFEIEIPTPKNEGATDPDWA